MFVPIPTGSEWAAGGAQAEEWGAAGWTWLRGLVGGSTESLATLRATYLARVAEPGERAKAVQQAGRTAEQIVRELGPARNALKLAIRAQGPRWAAIAAAARNLLKYGNTAGPSAEQLLGRQDAAAQG